MPKAAWAAATSITTSGAPLAATVRARLPDVGVWSALAPPGWRVRGTLDANRFAAGQFEVMPWIMSTDKYRAVEARHKEFPLGCHDMTLACTDSQYQKIDISPCKEGLFRKLLEKNPSRAKQIIDAAAAVASTLSRDIAQDLSLDQIREKLGKGGGASPVGGGGGPVASNSADFDGMLDDILKS